MLTREEFQILYDQGPDVAFALVSNLQEQSVVCDMSLFAYFEQHCAVRRNRDGVLAFKDANVLMQPQITYRLFALYS